MDSQNERLRELIARNWGYTTLRPLQQEAIDAELSGRDSLVVLPTGGGKSLCYQAPALVSGKTTVVVSPLVSLMKDQVDSLRTTGVNALQLDSMQSDSQLRDARAAILRSEVPLLYVSPTRLLSSSFQSLLQKIPIGSFVIDEAHCISHWGHDFWPEYRQLSRIKEIFPGVALHAYTATATERVRQDIIAQLGLTDPAVLVGRFDRPNLVYRIIPRRESLSQILTVLGRHQGEAGIIYCIRKKDVDELTDALQAKGVRALPYHAGLSRESRRDAQEKFAQEECDVIVATIAFGMGIDRSNVRFVLHSAMPKSVEHYQQETGRAGRDGLEAECAMLYSGSDGILWRSIFEKGAAERATGESLAPMLSHLADIDRFCRGAVCRHRVLSEYFDQTLPPGPCGACDLCLGETTAVADALIIAQKILSCVARVKGGFGINHIIDVLRGGDTERVRKFRHNELSTYGLLKMHSKSEIRDWIYQLLSQDLLAQETGEFPVLRLTELSWDAMKGTVPITLIEVSRKTESRAESVSWEGVDRGLFEHLRSLRRDLAASRGVPPFVIFSDTTLRQMATVRPSSLDGMHRISGIGEVKLRDFGQGFLSAISSYSDERGLTRDQRAASTAKSAPRPTPQKSSSEKIRAAELFRRGATIEEVAGQTGRSRSWAWETLAACVESDSMPSIAPWVHDQTVNRVREAVGRVGQERLKPLYLDLEESVPYDEIRVVLAFLARE
ncbi:MAG TPA: DNA helicase RecQ [Thermoanaerobaculia bacterium]|nr:DNA helicase RecQ [Thermoanaerobaculia bacterium]